MPKPRRLLFPNTVVFITSRVQEGLPFVPNDFMNDAIEGIIARASQLYPVSLISHVFMANHLHMMLLVKDPVDVVSFIRKVKSETGHLVNKLLGRRQRSVWCAGYDALPILTLEDCINKLAYIYTNPQNSNLVEKIDDYPGVSSWKMFLNKSHTKECCWIKRTEYEPLCGRDSLKETPDRQPCTLSIDPYSWLTSAYKGSGMSEQQLYDAVIERVRSIEQELCSKRREQGRSVIGGQALSMQPIDKSYSPKTFGKRMWCICRDKVTRCLFIKFVKSLIAEARSVYAGWKAGDLTLKYPPELFKPIPPNTASMIPFGLYS